MREPRKSDLQDRIVIRVPDGLRARIAVRAKENGRSVNTELVDLLARTYPEPTPQPDLLKRTHAIMDRIEKHPDAELGEELRWSLVQLINTATEYGILRGDFSQSEMEARMELEEKAEERRRQPIRR